MEIPVDIWMRGENHATTEHLTAEREPSAWTDGDVSAVLRGMLRALGRRRNPNADPDSPIVLRGFSWIVNPFESGGVVIALELTAGAAVAGPFEIAESKLTAMIERVLAADRASAPGARSDTVH